MRLLKLASSVEENLDLEGDKILLKFLIEAQY